MPVKKTKVFKMMKKPVEPSKKESYEFNFVVPESSFSAETFIKPNIYDAYINLKQLFLFLISQDNIKSDLENHFIKINKPSIYSNQYVTIVKRVLTENPAMLKYKKELAKYEKWYEENKEQIQKIEQEEQEAKRLALLEKEKEKLKKKEEAEKKKLEEEKKKKWETLSTVEKRFADLELD